MFSYLTRIPSAGFGPCAQHVGREPRLLDLGNVGALPFAPQRQYGVSQVQRRGADLAQLTPSRDGRVQPRVVVPCRQRRRDVGNRSDRVRMCFYALLVTGRHMDWAERSNLIGRTSLTRAMSLSCTFDPFESYLWCSFTTDALITYGTPGNSLLGLLFCPKTTNISR